MTNLHISISAEPVFHVGSFTVTNSMISTWLVMAFLIFTAWAVNRRLKNRRYSDRPDRLQVLIEFILEAFLNLTKTTAGSYQKTRVLFPFITTFFLFIMFSNWSGLLPGVGTIGIKAKAETEHETVATAPADEASDSHGTEAAVVNVTAEHDSEPVVAEKTHDEVAAAETAPESHTKFVPLLRAPTADLNTTLALALFSVVTIQFMGIKHLGLAYFQKFINFQSPILFVVGILEIFSEISKIVSFAFRLFGNIFAGEVLLTVIAALLPVMAPLPFLGLEIFVGFIQALVFSMLSLVFMNMATIAHDDHHT
jgi:F-type H+-transporting ATPase subunit a